MCGFIGVIERNGLTPDLSFLHGCRDMLAHRGPDAAGYYIDETTYLGFRRLAILDLSSDGDQPMCSDDEQLWVVFNGEIYNYIELRSGLEAKGYRFRSKSDTEVLLYLYREHGSQMFELLNGMFAIAIYDRREACVILARDRMGKKPLFYWAHAQGISFASELSALRSLPGFPTSFDNEALGLYLQLGWVPGWTCIYNGVKKLPPACLLRYDIRTGRMDDPQLFWSLPATEIEDAVSEDVWVDRIESLLWDATRIRLRSDVPLGTFLSSGIDSSLITAAAASQTQGNLSALTISFPDWADDEWPIAQQTAHNLGVHAIHRELRAEGAALLPEVMGHFDEPFADVSALPTALVCRMARETLTVALSGDGGDELFAGYDSHVRAWRWRGLDTIPLAWRRSPAHGLASFTSADSRPRRFLRRLGYPVGTWGVGSKLYPFEDWLASCVRPEYALMANQTEHMLDEHIERWPRSAPLDQAQRTDIRLYMLDDILVKVDRMSMLHSLEVRSPFLDYRMVELALRIPPSLRVRGGQNKYLLRCLARRHLPAAVVAAPKRGFGIPIRQWLFDSPYTNTFKELVSASTPSVPDPLVQGGGAALWANAETNPALLGALFRILSYRWWCEQIATSISHSGRVSYQLMATTTTPDTE
jgi:asparagine synthase (glutamine-hydrolysing)